MAKFDPFYKLSERLNPDELEFDKVCLSRSYPLETLINGNISECIAYLRLLIGTGGLNGVNAVHDALIDIKDHLPEKYDYIKNKVFRHYLLSLNTLSYVTILYLFTLLNL